MSNKIPNPNDKGNIAHLLLLHRAYKIAKGLLHCAHFTPPILLFGHLSFICHSDFVIWIFQ